MTLDASAPWWDPNSPQDGHPLVRHAPDDGQYYTPDPEQLSKMRSGRPTVIVPRARRDGAPAGFDPHQASVVHVDPDAPDGGVVVDTKKITRYAMDSAIQNARYPHQVYYQLGGPPQDRPEQVRVEERRVNPVLPNAYVAPKAAADGGQTTNPYVQEAPMSTAPAPIHAQAPLSAPPPGLPLTPSVFADQRAQQSQPQQQPYYPPPQQQPQYPQQQPPFQMPPQPQYPQQQLPYPPLQPQYPQQNDVLAMLVQGQNQLAQALGSLGSLVQRAAMPTQPVEVDAGGRFSNRDQVQSRPDGNGQRVVEQRQVRQGRGDGTFDEETTPIGHRPQRKAPIRKQQEDELRQVPSETRRQRYSDYLEESPPDDPIIAGFETLKIPYITGPSPEKARVKVIFEIPGRGKQMASYHGVEATKKCVVLTYDNRWEDGNPYMPPEPEEGDEHVEDVPIRLHVPSLKTTFTVYSVGMVFPHGVIDFIVLPLKEAEQLDYQGKG